MWFRCKTLMLLKVFLRSLIVIASINGIRARHSYSRSKRDDQYFQLNPQSNTYNFGYEVNPVGNFHHERRDHNGVTFGCFGYNNSKRELFVTYYIADQKGYRVVEPNKPFHVFLTDRISWQAFLLPTGCGRPSVPNFNPPGPELIFKPPGAISATTKRPSMINSMSTTTEKSAAGCLCSQPTITKKPLPAT